MKTDKRLVAFTLAETLIDKKLNVNHDVQGKGMPQLKDRSFTDQVN